MNTKFSSACAHSRMRAADYDESHRWIVSCKDCGHTQVMTHTEWRNRLMQNSTLSDSGVVALTENQDSGRLDKR